MTEEEKNNMDKEGKAIGDWLTSAVNELWNDYHESVDDPDYEVDPTKEVPATQHQLAHIMDFMFVRLSSILYLFYTRLSEKELEDMSSDTSIRVTDFNIKGGAGKGH
jgi:hypothetical protein